MKNTFFCAVMIVCLAGCSAINNPFSPQPFMGVCSKKGDTFDIGRYSFSIKLNPDWEYAYRPYDQDVSFHLIPSNLASAINVDSYHRTITWLEDAWTDIDEIYRRKREFYEEHVSKRPRKNPFYSIEMTTKGDLNCIREEVSWNGTKQSQPFTTPFSGALEHSLTYICAVPSQPELRPMDIGIAQSVGAGATPLDLEAILEPIFDTLVLNPNPPPVPERFR